MPYYFNFYASTDEQGDGKGESTWRRVRRWLFSHLEVAVLPSVHFEAVAQLGSAPSTRCCSSAMGR